MNKEKNTVTYLKKLEGIKLSDSSRSRMEEELLAHARFHSVRVGDDSRSIVQVPQRTLLFTLFKQTKSMTAVIIAIMLIAGGGTTFAAEGAVPGDFLYTIKTEVNENVKSAFAISSEAEARLQARLVEERLEEAEELAVRGELTAEASADLSARIQTHTNQAEEQSEKEEAKGDYESSATVRASLEGSFRAYADVLAGLNTRVSGNDGESLITDIRSYAEITANAQATATATIDASVDVKATAQATIDRADNYLTEVEVKLTQAASELSAQVYTRAELRLAEAVAVQAKAKASFQTEVYQAAYTAAQAAIGIASEVDAIINSMLRLQVNVNADPILEGMLDFRTETDEQTNLQIDSEENADTTESPDTTDSDRSTDSSVEVDATTDASVDTSVIDVDVQTDASVQGGLRL